MENNGFDLENPTTVDYGSLSPNLGTLRVIYGGNEKNEIDLFNPKPSDIHIKDIANGLSNKSHFSGLTDNFFSIAEHSILVFRLIEKKFEGEKLDEHKIEILKYALLHDAAEAYIGDMISPLKLRFPNFKKLEDLWEKAVFDKFEINSDLKCYVKPFDVRALNLEFDYFYNRVPSKLIHFLSPEESKDEFLNIFLQLFKKYENT